MKIYWENVWSVWCCCGMLTTECDGDVQRNARTVPETRAIRKVIEEICRCGRCQDAHHRPAKTWIHQKAPPNAPGPLVATR
ncbi:uncharacterized protein BKA55DRAFT_3843 [Fusarium redolens]|uniref:Uncharacterized protein n=1 Tax=Fusarium redolens TaxID=48865 RepID=A0A9P9KVP8_FUSRE|nr:uncharacterized protein BKA55DRAFT_3843 [Fusarium redolens]KAH7269253.1 hypothetical protein BKA55DRAFT_3843 [Fusarium redolens]